jgi:hypothetical protein
MTNLPPIAVVPDNWDDGIDDNGSIIGDYQEDSIDADSDQLTTLLAQISELIPENTDYDDMVRGSCEELSEFPSRQDSRWDFPLQERVELRTAQELHKVGWLVWTASAIIQRMLAQLNKNTRRRMLLPGPIGGPTWNRLFAPVKDEDRW